MTGEQKALLEMAGRAGESAERAAVVAWLRKQAAKEFDEEAHLLLDAANRIEAGEHRE